ncbi:MAG: hypothetical protein J6Y43_05035 [Clostridia bacterium]|nr:hypothetical protein [Clostridia bacterium]
MKHTGIPFWSWNDELHINKLNQQIDWMSENRYGGFIMHARSGLKTEYLGKEWFACVQSCCDKAKKLGMQAWVYDENGWPSGFVGGKLLENKDFREHYLSYTIGKYDEKAILHYDLNNDDLRLTDDIGSENCLNIFDVESNSNVDILNGDVVDAFIKHTHERYKNELKGKLSDNIEGFFTDEPQYSRAGVPLPKKLKEYYIANYGEDPIPQLGHLFVKKNGYRKFRYRFWKSCQQLMLNNFAEKVYNWCDDNGVKLIGHYVEERDNYSQMIFNAGIMPFYEYLHYPGIDWLCRRYMKNNTVRQLASVVAQLGKTYALTETFAMTGWDVTPRELKNIADYQYLFGCNLMCHHLIPYSETANRKYDHPTHFTPFNPWCDKGISELNDYFDALGEWLRKGKEDVRVGVLHTIRSAYLCYEYGNAESTTELDYSLVGLGERLQELRIPYHFIDETLLAKYGAVEGNKLRLGRCVYDYLVLPKIDTMDKTTEDLLCRFVKAGGKVCLTDGVPTYLEGEPYRYTYLKTNITLEDIAKTNTYSVKADGKLYTAHYNRDGRDYVFALNNTERIVSCRITCKGLNLDGEYDVLNSEVKSVGDCLSLEPLSAKIFCVSDGKPLKDHFEIVSIGDGEYEIEDFSDNYLVLDYARYSFDGENYGEKLPVIGIFQTLLQQRYKGKVWLKKTFHLRVIPDELQLMAENPNDCEISVNGKKVSFTLSLKSEEGFKVADIADLVKPGVNEIVCKYDFYEKDSVYFALFGENVGESLRNAICYDTRIEPMYLKGRFGVYSDDMRAGTLKNVWLAENFYIGSSPVKVKNILTDGFPFFAGRIKLKKEFSCGGGNVRLHFCGRLHVVEVYINGRYSGKVIFSDELDITEFVKKGKNIAEFVIYTSNRNLLGPHHEGWTEENFYVSPDSFEKTGTWTDGKCNDFTERYSFVRFGFFE